MEVVSSALTAVDLQTRFIVIEPGALLTRNAVHPEQL